MTSSAPIDRTSSAWVVLATPVTWAPKAWAASRHMQAGHHDAYERVVGRYGHADHPLIRFTHAYLYEDGEALYTSPAAALWLREQGEDHAANLVELFGVVAGLMTMGRFVELDAATATMAGWFRTLGAPTLLHLALGMLGYSARFQGRHEEAMRCLAESARIDLPLAEGRTSPGEPAASGQRVPR